MQIYIYHVYLQINILGRAGFYKSDIAVDALNITEGACNADNGTVYNLGTMSELATGEIIDDGFIKSLTNGKRVYEVKWTRVSCMRVMLIAMGMYDVYACNLNWHGNVWRVCL